MNLYNETRILTMSRSSSKDYLKTAIVLFILPAHPDNSDIIDIERAVSAAVENSIKHGYRNSLGVIETSVRIFEDRTVEITVTDKGEGIENISLARQSGNGFNIMETSMDTLIVESEKGNGTTIIMTKSLKNNAIDDKIFKNT